MGIEFFQGFLLLLQPINLLAVAAGSIAGLIFGMIPGLTTTTCIIMFLPLTFVMDPVTSVALLLGIYTGGMSGGSFSAILINIPGTPSASATQIDGFPMAKRGEPARALSISITASLVGGLFSFVALALFAPQLANVALQFKTPELFALIFFGISIISSFAVKSVVKGFISAVLGLIICTIGQDPIRGIGRFTFDNVNLLMGFNIIPILVGLFAFPEIINIFKEVMTAHEKVKGALPFRKIFPSWADFKVAGMANFIGSLVGTFIGILPGAGGPIAIFMAYDYTRKFSKRPEKYGTGIPEGIASVEAANSAVCGGALIPTMTLGIPGDGITAIIIGALIIQGLAPGPLLFVQHASFAYTMIAAYFVANWITALIGYLGVRWIVKLLDLPKAVLLPLIIITCFIGSYAPRNSFFDVFTMFGFGLLGLGMRWLQITVIPMVLAIVLGDQLESHLRLALTSSQGDISIFFASPISLFFLLLSAFTILFPFIMQRKKKGTHLGFDSKGTDQ
ncbi:MAG: tripartite tricarboxylate transporter permease [Thermodesulfobacteriota bacterium]